MALIDYVSEKGSTVLSFYNVVSQDNKGVRDSIGITVDPEDLKWNIHNLLAEGYTAVSVQDVVEGTAPEKSFALMACDGYDIDRDGGILEFTRLHDVPLAFSIPAGLVGNNKPSWTNQIEIALEEALNANVNTRDIAIKAPGTDEAVFFSSAPEAIAARNKLKDLKPAEMDGDEYVRKICTALTESFSNPEIEITPTTNSESPFDKKMSWDQIRSLHDDGHLIVSHGFAHTDAYPNLSNTKIVDDIVRAREAFQEKAGVTPTMLTYPEGKFDKRVTSLAVSAGITAAFTMEEGAVMLKTDRMALPRVTITQDMIAIGPSL